MIFLFILNNYCSWSSFSSSGQPYYYLSSCSISLNIGPPPHTLLIFVMCLRLLYGFCDSPPHLHLNHDSLLGLFLHLYHRTKVYTLVSKKVSWHTLLKIMVKFASHLFDCCGWLNNSEISSLFCKFPWNQSFNCNQFHKCFSCLSFLLFSLIYSITSQSIAFCCIMFKYLFIITTWL